MADTRPERSFEKVKFWTEVESVNFTETGLPVGRVPTRKLEAPETGCPSAEMTANLNTYRPGVRRFLGVNVYVDLSGETVNDAGTGDPVAERSCTLVEVVETGSLNTTETEGGAAMRVEAFAGVVLTT